MLFVRHLVVDSTLKDHGFKPKKVLSVFAHPDDEIMVAGTLKKWVDEGVEVHLLYLTKGEEGPTSGIVDKKDLGQERSKELKEVSKLLGVTTIKILDFPDRYLNQTPSNLVYDEIKEVMDTYLPDTLICFDNIIGLYGHTDHVTSGQIALDVVDSGDAPYIKTILIMTLSDKMLNLALKVSNTFKDNYKNTVGLPKANLAFTISKYAKIKKQVCLAHKTQRDVVNDVQPYVTKIPAFIYYRIFSQESFHRINVNRK